MIHDAPQVPRDAGHGGMKGAPGLAGRGQSMIDEGYPLVD